ncbi:MAG: hypothetical protein Tsb0014_32090 [Pleurocapsa sp.]
MKQFLKAPELNNILVVDDNPSNLHLLTDLLKKYDYEVRPVPNGKLALSAAEINPPDLILLDIMMPDLNGYQVCQQLKNNEKTKDIPIIFITAVNEPIDKLKAFSLGGVDYITKPFDIKDVLIRVKNQLGVCFFHKKLKAKNAKLNETIHQLQQNQKKLIKAEKSWALDNMVRGINQQINYPLSEIDNALSEINRFSDSGVEKLPKLLLNLSPEKQKYFAALLKQAETSNRILSDLERQEQKKQIISKLTPLKIQNATKVADIFIDLGCDESIDHFLPLLTDTDYLEILENAYLIYALNKNIKAIAKSKQQFNKLVNSLENYTKTYHPEDKYNAHIRNTLDMALKQFTFNENLKIIKNYQNVPPVCCYPEMLQKAWTNIIDNALKAMGNFGTLTINLEQQDKNIVVDIIDTGKGISKELIQQMCVPFFTTRNSEKSIGLGLSIVKKIIEKHNGNITINSMPGKTKLTVTLPIFSS